MPQSKPKYCLAVKFTRELLELFYKHTIIDNSYSLAKSLPYIIAANFGFLNRVGDTNIHSHIWDHPETDMIYCKLTCAEMLPGFQLVPEGHEVPFSNMLE